MDEKGTLTAEFGCLNMSRKLIVWIISLVIVNFGWVVISGQSVTQEINRPGADFSEERSAEFSSFQGDEVDVEVEHCFESINGVTYNVSLTIEQDGKEIYDWEGTTEDPCVIWASTESVGKVVFVTQIEEGVDVTTNLRLSPLSNSMVGGIAIFSLLTVLVAFGEAMFRGYIAERRKGKSNKPEESKSDSNQKFRESLTEGIWQEPVRPI